jgi:hypothetical protein
LYSGGHITIIGVAAAGFLGEQVGSAPDLWLPLTLWPQVIPGRNLLQSPGTAWLNIIGRRRPDVGDHVAAVPYRGVSEGFLTDIFGAAAPKILAGKLRRHPEWEPASARFIVRTAENDSATIVRLKRQCAYWILVSQFSPSTTALLC